MWMARRQSVRSSEWSWKRRGTDELWSHQKQTIYSDTKIIYAKEQRSWPRFCSGVLGRVIYLADGWRDLISRRSPRGAHSCGRWRSAGKKIKMQFNKNNQNNELNVRKTWQDSCDVIILWRESGQHQIVQCAMPSARQLTSSISSPSRWASQHFSPYNVKEQSLWYFYWDWGRNKKFNSNLNLCQL